MIRIFNKVTPLKIEILNNSAQHAMNFRLQMNSEFIECGEVLIEKYRTIGSEWKATILA